MHLTRPIALSALVPAALAVAATLPAAPAYAAGAARPGHTADAAALEVIDAVTAAHANPAHVNLVPAKPVKNFPKRCDPLPVPPHSNAPARAGSLGRVVPAPITAPHESSPVSPANALALSPYAAPDGAALPELASTVGPSGPGTPAGRGDPPGFGRSVPAQANQGGSAKHQPGSAPAQQSTSPAPAIAGPTIQAAAAATSAAAPTPARPGSALPLPAAIAPAKAAQSGPGAHGHAYGYWAQCPPAPGEPGPPGPGGPPGGPGGPGEPGGGPQPPGPTVPPVVTPPEESGGQPPSGHGGQVAIPPLVEPKSNQPGSTVAVTGPGNANRIGWVDILFDGLAALMIVGTIVLVVRLRRRPPATSPNSSI